MAEQSGGLSWYCVRAVFRFSRKPTSTYEERMTLWQTTGLSAAITLAEEEAG